MLKCIFSVFTLLSLPDKSEILKKPFGAINFSQSISMKKAYPVDAAEYELII